MGFVARFSREIRRDVYLADHPQTKKPHLHRYPPPSLTPWTDWPRLPLLSIAHKVATILNQFRAMKQSTGCGRATMWRALCASAAVQRGLCGHIYIQKPFEAPPARPSCTNGNEEIVY